MHTPAKSSPIRICIDQLQLEEKREIVDEMYGRELSTATRKKAGSSGARKNVVLRGCFRGKRLVPSHTNFGIHLANVVGKYCVTYLEMNRSIGLKCCGWRCF